MTLTKGNALPAEARAEALRAFVYRPTAENGYPGRNPARLRIPAMSDDEWLALHAFWVTKAGKLAARRHAEPHFLAD